MPRYNTKPNKSDPLLILLTCSLVFIGIVMIATAGIIQAHVLFEGKDDYFFFTHQIMWAIIGFSALFIVSKIHYSFWQKNALPLLIFGILFLLTVFIPGLSKGEIKGALRWIQIGPINAQPSEFIKLALAIYLAAWLSQKGREDIQNIKYGFLPFFILLGVIVFLLEQQSDLGTTIVITIISLVAFFISGASVIQLIILFSLVSSVALILIRLVPYRIKRFTTFLNPFSDPTGAGYHINQALLALGTGGLFGVGFGHSRQKYRYLPEPVTDSIFAIIGEELGFIGTLGIILLFLLFAYRAFKIALHAPDSFSKILASTITAWISFQAFVNIAAMVSLIPMTGIPLPFISYGGSSLVILLTAVGVLLNISKYSSYEKQASYSNSSQRWRDRRTSHSSRRAH